MMFNLSYKELGAAGFSLYSQGNQDGVLIAIFNQIGHGDKVLVDIGARDGLEISNTANLRLRYGWSALLIDAEPLADIVKKEIITKDNVNDVIWKYGIWEFDFLNIDIDGNDRYVWEAIKHRPRVVSIEYNSKFKNDESYTIEYNPEHKWEGDDYYGASLLSMVELGEKKGYTLVYVVDRYDAIFIRKDLIHTEYVPPTLDELLPEPIIAHEKVSNKKWVSY